MPHKGTSPCALDLFNYTLITPTPASEPASVAPRWPALASLSNAQLAQHLGDLLEEVKRHLKTGRGRRSELEAAARQASLSLKSLADRAPRHGTFQSSSNLRFGHEPQTFLNVKEVAEDDP